MRAYKLRARTNAVALTRDAGSRCRARRDRIVPAWSDPAGRSVGHRVKKIIHAAVYGRRPEKAKSHARKTSPRSPPV